jgi:hypothetical protein
MPSVGSGTIASNMTKVSVLVVGVWLLVNSTGASYAKDWEYLFDQRPRSVIQGSPDGHSWGYGGSGPHDLALDILNWHCPPKGQDCIKCFKGVCSNEAWRLRHQFVIDFLASMPEEGGAIPAEAIASWIEEHRIVDEENDYCY